MSSGVWYDYRSQYGVEEAVRIIQYEHSHLQAISATDLEARPLTEHCVGTVGMAAGTFWPYKFITGLFERMVRENNLSIQMNGPLIWIGHLLHEMRPFISPVRANVQRQVPHPNTLSVDNRSFWLRYGEKEYDYLIQRSDGSYIIGRANTGRRATADDSKLDLVPQAHLRAVTPRFFDFGTKEVQATHAWCGAVAFTKDQNPLVGPILLPGRRHQWMYAGVAALGEGCPSGVPTNYVAYAPAAQNYPEIDRKQALI
ncbi:hypothetical protein LA080_014344 [Diaporthe eres]|nr:hypothetical protein LA080_014344 [Diaporthe eres]